MPRRVYFTTTPEHWQPWEGTPYVQAVVDDFRLRRQGDYVVAECARDAEIILFLEPNYFKGRDYARRLLRHELIREYPNRCFVFNYDVFPIGYLPGVYVSMHREAMDYKRFRSSCYLQEPNPFCIHDAISVAVRPRYLFSFRGARSAPVRDALLRLHVNGNVPAMIHEVPRWYNHTDDEKKQFVREVLESHFVLCPRGLAVSSHRLFETMKMGRVPVILSDPWVPPEGPSWLDCSVRISEKNVPHIADILAAREKDAAEMGRRARAEWERWFSPEARAHTALRYIEDILCQRDRDEREVQKTWLKADFYTPYGLHPLQRVRDRLKSGDIAEPMFRRAKKLVQRVTGRGR